MLFGHKLERRRADATGDSSVNTEFRSSVPRAYGWTSSVSHSCDYLAPEVIELLRTLAVERVLDLGCGNGALCGALHTEGWQAVGVEPDEAGVAIARTLYPAVSFHPFGVHSDPANLLAIEDPFDVVVSTEVVEHLFAPRQLPAYAAAVLKPSGWLIVSTPYHGYLKNLALSVFDKWDHHHTALWEGGHVKFFSRATLSELLSANGFEVIDFRGVGRLPWLWKSMVLVARKK